MSTNFEDLIGRGVAGSQPAAGTPGRLYYDTTNSKMTRDNGSSWDDCEPITSGTADDGWTAADAMTYAAADDPTYTMTCEGDQSTKYYAGMRIKLTQSTGGTKYFIVTKVAYSESTTITIYGGTDYNLEDEAISDPYYSVAKAPAGFPLDPLKWTVETKDTSDRAQATPNQNTWYNLGSITISIPIGVWRVNYQVVLWEQDASSSPTFLRASVTLSTANNSQSDADFTGTTNTTYATTTTIVVATSLYREKYLNLSSKTSYYLNAMTSLTGVDSIDFRGSTFSPTIIRAVCAYL